MNDEPVSMKYIFVCDPDECDTLFEVTTADGYDFPSGEVKLKCPCGRDAAWISVEKKYDRSENEKPVYRCPDCGITSTNPVDSLLKYACLSCLSTPSYAKEKE